MNSAKLGFKDFLDNLIRAVLLLIQISISIFCLMLVSKQFSGGVNDIAAYAKIADNNLIFFTQHTVSNIFSNDQQRVDLDELFSKPNLYSWHYDADSGNVPSYIFFGDYSGPTGKMMSSENTKVIFTSKKTDLKTIETTKSKYNMLDAKVEYLEWFFDSNVGAIELVNKVAVYNNDLQERFFEGSESRERIIGNLHLFNSTNKDVYEVTEMLNDEGTKYFPQEVHQLEWFEERRANDVMLLSFFSLVLFFVLTNLVVSLKNIIEKKSLEFYVHRLYGLSKADGSIRLATFISCISLFPSLFVILLSASILSYGKAVGFWILGVVIFNSVLFLSFKNMILKDEISTEIRRNQ